MSFLAPTISKGLMKCSVLLHNHVKIINLKLKVILFATLKSKCKLLNYIHWAEVMTFVGMDGVDKEKVQRVVYEMSKGSKYFENEERKEAYMKQKIENMRAQCAKLKATDISHYQRVADKRIVELEATRDLSRIWLHVDMDAFYAAVETLSNPSLKGRPMAVGSMSMISTANYEARKFGVRAAMPGFIACKLCPELVFVPTDFKKYTYYSDLTRKVYQEYDPNFTAASLDEAYLDITKVCKERSMTGEEVAEELRLNVYKATGLTCSAGVSPNRLLAKQVCSDINKPNGQFVLPNDRAAIMTFISSLPIRKIGGIGKVTEHILKDVFEIKTCEDLLQKGSFLCALFSPSSADFFISVGLGLGGTDAPQVRSRKSMSNERTFSATKDEAFFYQKLEMLSADMEKGGLCGRTLTLKLKTASFEVRTRAVTLQSYIWSSKDILKHASKLLKPELPVSLRLIGLRMSHFNEDKGGGTLSDPMQRTLSNFIIPGDGNREIADEEHSDVKDSYGEAHCDAYTNPSCDHLSELDQNICSSSDNNEKAAEHNELEGNGYKDQINENTLVENWTKSSAFDPHVTETHSLEGKNQDHSRRIGFSDNETEPSSSNHEEPFIWLDNYKCLLCGVELPPSFVDERQEHSDFHLAEKLQEEEESGDSYKKFPLKHRMRQKESIVGQSKGKKKQKHSPSNDKHIPIDAFFTKTSQNS
ncbi:DNA polymerase kappa isoform X3 [Cynara cardunculus var. scolymus]|uniref:DNA polymerase kappa isoform X3 n=1 Tax=Cynara cardunculus var. scolymus TaxID=59895 RepID=UPI000D62E2F2|nr:DNA polymerase kappa isoform X3 [Cynara cardunculus var. scolymus]